MSAPPWDWNRRPLKKRRKLEQGEYSSNRLRTSQAESSSNKRQQLSSVANRTIQHAWYSQQVANPPPKKELRSLDILPDELLLSIFEFLPRDSLAKLCRTNRHCRHVAETLLYEAVNNGIFEPRFMDPISSLVNNRRLSKYVRSLDLKFDEEDFAYRGKFAVEKFERFCENSTTVLWNACWIQKLSICEDTSSFGTWSPRFSRVTPQFGWLNLVIKPFWRQFTRLESVYISAAFRSIDSLAVIFRLPALRKLSLDRVYQSFALQNWEIADGACVLRELHITSSVVHYRAIEQLLQRIKGLRHVSYHICSKRWAGSTNSNFDKTFSRPVPHAWDGLAAALTYHKESLESISVSEAITEADAFSRRIDCCYPGPLSSFTDFPALRTLDAPLEAFLREPRKNAPNLNLKPFIPTSLDTFRLQLAPREENAAWYASALESLIDPSYSGGSQIPSIDLVVDWDFPFAAVRLSRPMALLGSAGIEAVVVIDDTGRGSERMGLDEVKAVEVSQEESSEDEDEEDGEESEGEESSELEESSEEPSSESSVESSSEEEDSDDE